MIAEENVNQSNRRQEPRFRGRCKRLIWRKTGKEPAPGVLCDFSASGAAFLVSRRQIQPPQEGDQIVVRHAVADAESQIYQVMRSEPVGCGYTLVGCHRAVDTEVTKSGVRLPPLAAAVNPKPAAFRSPRRAPSSHDAHEKQPLLDVVQQALTGQVSLQSPAIGAFILSVANGAH